MNERMDARVSEIMTTQTGEMMNAIVFEKLGVFKYEKRPIPMIQNNDEILIKILAASICGTDVHILENPPGVIANTGIILGHECVGEVVAMGEQVKGYTIGDHLILDNNIPCGICPECQSGHSNLCGNRASMGVHIDGVFAQYAVAPESMTVKISRDIPVEAAIFAEPLNCVMGAVKKLKVMPGDTVLILGGGPIGQYFTAMMKLAGAGKVLVSEISDFREQFATMNGANRVINPLKENLLEEVLKETNGIGADTVIDAVGILLPDAIRTVKTGGEILLFGMNATARLEINQNDIVARGLTIYGNFIGLNTLRNVANVLENNLVNFENMITHKLPLSKFEEGFEAMKKGEAMEVVLYPFKD